MKRVEYEIEAIKKACDKMPDFMKIEDVCAVLRVSYMTVYRLVTIGEIDATKVGGVWRIPKNALMEYLQLRHPFNWEK